MSRLVKRLFVVSFSLLLISAIAQKPVPELWGHHIHDEAHVLSQDTIDLLEKRLAVYEDATSNQVALLVIATLDGESAKEYSLRVAEAWKLGQKNKDNGVLLLVAVDDHKMRIEVGQGLQGVLTDAQCNRIIRNEMAPAFRRAEYDAGIVAGIDGIIKSIGGEYTANDVDSEMDVATRIVIGLIIFVFLGFATVFALVLNDKIAWWMYAILIPFYIAFPWISIGVTGGIILFFVYVIGFPIAKKFIPQLGGGKSTRSTSSNNNNSSGFSNSSSWSNSSSNNSDSGSSFSGGGGSFDGGGSSGSW